MRLELVATNVVLRNLSDGATVVNDIDLADINSATIFSTINEWTSLTSIKQTKIQVKRLRI